MLSRLFCSALGLVLTATACGGTPDDESTSSEEAFTAAMPAPAGWVSYGSVAEGASVLASLGRGAVTIVRTSTDLRKALVVGRAFALVLGGETAGTILLFAAPVVAIGILANLDRLFPDPAWVVRLDERAARGTAVLEGIALLAKSSKGLAPALGFTRQLSIANFSRTSDARPAARIAEFLEAHPKDGLARLLVLGPEAVRDISPDAIRNKTRYQVMDAIVSFVLASAERSFEEKDYSHYAWLDSSNSERDKSGACYIFMVKRETFTERPAAPWNVRFDIFGTRLEGTPTRELQSRVQFFGIAKQPQAAEDIAFAHCVRDERLSQGLSDCAHGSDGYAHFVPARLCKPSPYSLKFESSVYPLGHKFVEIYPR